MGTTPTTNNKVADIVNKVLKALIEGAGETSLETTIISAQPWLASPVLKQLLDFFIGIIGKFVYENAAMAATKIILDVQTNLEEGTANAAFQNLQMAVASGDPNAIKQASTDLDQAYAKLIHFDGSASPDVVRTGANKK